MRDICAMVYNGEYEFMDCDIDFWKMFAIYGFIICPTEFLLEEEGKGYNKMLGKYQELLRKDDVRKKLARALER